MKSVRKIVCGAVLSLASSTMLLAHNDQPEGGLVPPTSASEFSAGQMDMVLRGAWRSSAMRSRDVYRHPKETLQFLGVQPDQVVLQVNPDDGFYSAILAPLLHDNGHYLVAVPLSSKGAWRTKFGKNKKIYGKVKTVQYNPKDPVLSTSGSVDVVLAFNQVHAWMKTSTATAMFKACLAVLRPGGVLGIVERTAKTTVAHHPVGAGSKRLQAEVVRLASAAGFKLDASSNINAQPREMGGGSSTITAHASSLRRNKHAATPHSDHGTDRMTLRFIKPATVVTSTS